MNKVNDEEINKMVEEELKQVESKKKWKQEEHEEFDFSDDKAIK